MTFITGIDKVCQIGPCPMLAGANVLEMILRESGRFIIRDAVSFIALSEKKTRSIAISGTIPSSFSAQDFYEYDAAPSSVSTQYESGDLFPQDLLNEYKIDDINIYGIAILLNMSLSAEPSDAIAKLNGAHLQYWVSRQPMTSWASEDCINATFSAYNSVPLAGVGGGPGTEGVSLTTVKKKQIPVFVPIKTSFTVRKTGDKIYLYNDVDIKGYCQDSTLGGALAGTAVIDHRLIVGKGYLPEEVEELLSPSQ